MQTTLVLKFISQNLSDSNNLEEQLTDFVKTSLADSYSLDINDSLQLLDKAWEAQKLLWQMRDGDRVRSTNS
ncbi:MAG: hypothetical protein HC849_24490 [Oscillatoriales cyanobacterium RU_3_3]|nr:hypothetical protein [Microcoleus sp. SU_5_6]NJL69731.1 hypothetical protein [Microcoleus sp. SM1_3_4]NJM62642.1 hypothetical protein [Oscillatoriales cyanobacterium RU_3_3]NJR22446.1 hypothetical protein [Richelia sp. CSU_2_1]